MGIISFSEQEIFETDSQEYDILHNAVLACKGVPGALVEIGTRRGGSAKIIIDALAENQDTDRSMFCIDPYGNIDYPQHVDSDTYKQVKLDYDNTMRNRSIPSLYYYAYSKGLNFSFFCMEDTEFFKRFADGVPVYEQVKKIENQYAFVFFDGPHVDYALKTEVEFFIERAPIGAVFVMDDIWMYNHSAIEDIIFHAGFSCLEKRNVKASYKRFS